MKSELIKIQTASQIANTKTQREEKALCPLSVKHTYQCNSKVTFGKGAKEKLRDVNAFCTIKRCFPMTNNASNDRSVASYNYEKTDKKPWKMIPLSLRGTPAFPIKMKKKRNDVKK